MRPAGLALLAVAAYHAAMLTLRPWLAAAWLVLAACGPGKPDPGDSATGTATTGTTADPAPTTTTSAPTTGASGSADASATAATTGTTDAPDTTDTGAPPPVCAEVTPEDAARCAEETVPARCRAVEVDPAIGGCKWVEWTAVRLVDGMCMFGDPRGACYLDPCSPTGCTDFATCGSPGPGGFLEGPMLGLSIGLGDWCLAPPAPGMPCDVDAEGNVLAGPPECACLCELP